MTDNISNYFTMLINNLWADLPWFIIVVVLGMMLALAILTANLRQERILQLECLCRELYKQIDSLSSQGKSMSISPQDQAKYLTKTLQENH